MTPDKETKALLTEGEHIAKMLDSEGWNIVKRALDAKIVDLQMIGNVTGETAEEKMKDMAARIAAVAILFDWLKMDVYGRAQQHEANVDLFAKQKENSYIELH